MMKKISRFILSAFFAALFLVVTGASSAWAVCDQDIIERDIAKSINTTASQLRTSLESYNRATKNFEASCGEVTDEFKGQPLSFDLRTLQHALSFDRTKYAYLTDMSQYEDTGIKWGEVTTTNDNCYKLKIAAWTELDRYSSLYTKAVVVFGIAGRESNLPYSCVCPEGSNETQCTAYTNDRLEEQKTGDKCETFATYLSSLSSCPLCPLFQVVLNTDAKIADVAWRSLGKALKSIVMIFFLVYLALETLKIVSNVAGSSMGSYLKSVLILGFKATLTYLLLDNSAYVYGYFISPVLQAGLDMGTSLISISAEQASVCLNNNANVDFVATPGNVLDASLLDSIMRTVRCYGHTATIMPSVGKGLICHGWANDGSLLPNFGMWLSGILFFVFGLFIWLVVSFYLIDCTVQLGMLCGVIPVLVACWPFKITQSYAIKGVQLIMNTFFNYVMLGIVLLLGVEIVNFATGQKSGSMDMFMDAMNNNNLQKLYEIANLDGIEILILVICSIFAFKLIENTNALADKFSKGTGMNIASRIGGMAASAGVAAAVGGGNIGAKVGGAMLDETGISEHLGDAKDSVKDFFTSGAAAVGRGVGLGKYQPKNQTADGKATSGSRTIGESMAEQSKAAASQQPESEPTTGAENEPTTGNTEPVATAENEQAQGGAEQGGMQAMQPQENEQSIISGGDDSQDDASTSVTTGGVTGAKYPGSQSGEEQQAQSVSSTETGSITPEDNSKYRISEENGKATSISTTVNGKTYTLSEKDMEGFTGTRNGERVTFDMLVDDVRNNDTTSMLDLAIKSKGHDENGNSMTREERQQYNQVREQERAQNSTPEARKSSLREKLDQMGNDDIFQSDNDIFNGYNNVLK